MERHDDQLLTTPDGTAPFTAPAEQDAVAVPRRPAVDVTRIITTTEVVVGAVLVARYLSRRPGAAKALVTMGPGGWVSMKGGTLAVRRGSRPWARPTPVQPGRRQAAPLWARALSAVPLGSLLR